MRKLALALFAALVALAPAAASAKPPSQAPHATIALADTDPLAFYWSSAVGSTAVAVECDGGFTASVETGGWTPINGFVFVDGDPAGDCTADLLNGARVLASVSFTA